MIDYIDDWFEFVQRFLSTGDNKNKNKDQGLAAAVQFNVDFAQGCQKRYTELTRDEIFALMAEARETIKSAGSEQYKNE